VGPNVLRIEGLHKSFGGQALFDGVDWFLGDRDRIGLVGRNGTGKSTLLKILSGSETPDAGDVVSPKGQTVGYLPQFDFTAGPGTVLEESRRAFERILDWRWEREEIETRLAREDLPNGEAESLLVRHAELDESFRHHGGYEIERKVHQVLTGLGFSERDFDRPVRTLSGGWQMRVALARLLLLAPDVLLLDEPTNHLDIEARVWLEGFLAEYPGGFVLVSHDRHFLDRTVNRITEIVGRRLIDYEGDFSRYVEQREARYEMALKSYERQQEEIARIERFIERFRAKNTKATQVQSRIKMLEKLPRLEPPHPPPRPIRFRFPQPSPSGRIVVRLRGIHKSYGAQRVFSGIDLDLERGERVALVGPNGAGKSTLMRILAGEEQVQAGTREIGHKVGIEFFGQDEADQLPQENTLIDETIDRAPIALVPQVRGLLGAFLFKGDAVEKKIRVLSGGERNRFALMLMLLRPANLLLLDEPTNHLDMEAQDVLLSALQAYEGTLAFVSHDHDFIERLATRVIEVGGGGIRTFPGDYESYLWKKAQEAEALLAAAAPIDSPTAPAPVDAGSGGEPERPRGRDTARRARKIVSIEEKIASLEDRRVKLEALMATEGFFRDPERSQFYVEELRAVNEGLGRLYEEWETLSEEDH
jgi:ATP-binding cassette, subfamily F, member 3